MLAQGYVENSMHNRQMIYNGITQKIATDIEPKPSTSKETTTVQENDDFEINWADYDDDFTGTDISDVNDLASKNDNNNPKKVNPISTKVVSNGFTTANKIPISVPVGIQSKLNNNKNLFINKPPIKLTFNNQSTDAPKCRRENCENVLKDSGSRAIPGKRNETMSARKFGGKCTSNKASYCNQGLSRLQNVSLQIQNLPNYPMLKKHESYCENGITKLIRFVNARVQVREGAEGVAGDGFYAAERRVSDSGPASRESSKEHSARSGRLSASNIGGGSQPLNRLARLLNQRPSFTPSDEIPRRLSWERRDYSTTSSCLPRSSSIDSVAEWGLTGIGASIDGNNGASTGSSYGLFVEHPPPRRSPSPLLGARNDRLSIVSPNIGRRVKGHRAIVEVIPESARYYDDDDNDN
ncbi:PREDICTED: uncharacterized protein LOC105449149 [Wasmannia auropunctata]|uniref:uncharacterized protein LOC105449149 n=1 Tax=Wasmannia auropunctata TaxID=64793 RepID=UPI0005F0012E|nr:PREDICTED: uncharacterized protein LOC105449149 [Wasmannia auropunctata]